MVSSCIQGSILKQDLPSIQLENVYVGEQFSDPTNVIEGSIPAYDVMDLSASYVWGRIRLESGINKLLNRMYFTRRATGYPGPGILPSEGRGWYVGMQIRV